MKGKECHFLMQAGSIPAIGLCLCRRRRRWLCIAYPKESMKKRGEQRFSTTDAATSLARKLCPWGLPMPPSNDASSYPITYYPRSLVLVPWALPRAPPNILDIFHPSSLKQSFLALATVTNSGQIDHPTSSMQALAVALPIAFLKYYSLIPWAFAFLS